jgi:hypothetical protein
MMLTPLLLAALGFCQSVAQRAPLADGDFVGKLAEVSADFMHATEYFVVNPDTAIAPTGKAAAELDRVMPWLRKMARPELAGLLERAAWTAYKDAGHRVEPLVADCTFNGDTVRWSFGAKNAAVLCDLAQATDVSDAKKASAFALSFLDRLLALPDRPADSVKTFLKRHGDVWGGYVDRGVFLNGGRPTTPWEWDTNFLFITDGAHVLVRWVLLEPEDRSGRKTTGYASGPVPPKTKSRFDE